MSNQISEFIEKNDHSSTESTPVIVGKKQPIVHELDRNVLKILEKEGPITRSKLVSLTGIARSTLYDSLLRLIQVRKFLYYEPHMVRIFQIWKRCIPPIN
ncbi:MAG: hypothetical protein ACW97X_10180 [Candidatus Hodarchaeales archaeon]|jgi:hypothetical protein